MESVNSKGSSKFFYGWFIVLISGLGIGASVSAFIPGTLGLLVGPLGEEFGWSSTKIVLGGTFATYTTILVAPFLGAIVDRFGARLVIAISFIIEALLIVSFRYIDTNIGWFYARYAALAILATGTTAVPFARVLSLWFNRRRGLALGIALACYGIGLSIWSSFTQFLFDHVGWRTSFTYLGGIILIIILPIILIVLRDTPESMGLVIDGVADDTPRPSEDKPEATGVSLGQAIRQVQFWKIAVGFFFVAAAIQGVMVNLVPLLTSAGFTAQTAALIFSSLGIAMVVGRVCTGWLMDRIFAPYVAIAFLLFAFLGVLMLGLGAVGVLAVLAAVFIGLTNGSEADVVPYITSRYYGLKQYTRIYGTFFSCYCLGSGFGYPMTAYLVEKAGGYHILAWTHTGALVLAGLIFITFMRFPKTYSN